MKDPVSVFISRPHLLENRRLGTRSMTLPQASRGPSRGQCLGELHKCKVHGHYTRVVCATPMPRHLKASSPRWRSFLLNPA